jgi:HYR domain/Regulator of chromosome condensation (RCC1) repeat
VTLVLLVAALFSAIGLLVTVQSTDAQAQTSAPTRQVWAWGLNDHGQLGDGTTTNRLTPIEVSGLSDVQAIAAADGYHSLAISGAPAQDTTPPTLILPADITEEALDATGTTVTYTVTATDDVDGSLPTNSINCSSASGSLFPIGTTEVNCSATDAAGNIASDSFNVLVRDTTAPVIAPHDDVSATATSSNGANVSYTSPETTDAVDGPGTANCTPGSGSLFPIGTTQVNCSAADVAGNQASGSFQVNVVYAFGSGSGGSFGEPVRSTELNQLAAGAGVPVRFGLGADYGLNIFAEGYPTSKKISCTTLLPTYPVEETATVTKSGLTYDAASGLYTYVWKTDRGRGRAPAGNSTLN